MRNKLIHSLNANKKMKKCNHIETCFKGTGIDRRYKVDRKKKEKNREEILDK